MSRRHARPVPQVGRCKERLIFAESFTTPDGRSLPKQGATDALRWLQRCDLVEPFKESSGERDDLDLDRTAHYYSTARALAGQLEEDVGEDGEGKNEKLLTEMRKMYTLAGDILLARRVGAQIDAERLIATMREASSQEESVAAGQADASIDKQAMPTRSGPCVFLTRSLDLVDRWSML